MPPPPLILVIDDEDSLVLALKAALQRAGYRVLVAQNGVEGLERARQARPDLILCDVMMPPPNGHEVRRSLSADPDTARIPFIFLSARASQADQQHGLAGGADDYITKPFARAELLARIQAVLDRAAGLADRGQPDPSAPPS